MGLQNQAVAEPLNRARARRFEPVELRKTIIAFLKALHGSGRQGSLSEVLIALEVIDAQLAGSPHTLRSLAAKLDIPYTSVSRIVYSLTREASADGILNLVQDTADRRRKHIDVDFDALLRASPYGRLVDDSLVEH